MQRFEIAGTGREHLGCGHQNDAGLWYIGVLEVVQDRGA